MRCRVGGTALNSPDGAPTLLLIMAEASPKGASAVTCPRRAGYAPHMTPNPRPEPAPQPPTPTPEPGPLPPDPNPRPI